MDEQPPTDPPPLTPAADPPPPPPAPPAQPNQWATPMGQTSAPTASNGMAVAALVLGIIGIIMFWSIWLGVLLGGLAILFGILGLNRAKQGAPNKGLATAGLVLGIIAVVGSLLWLAAIVAIFETNEGVFEDIGNQIEFCIENPNDPSCD